MAHIEISDDVSFEQSSDLSNVYNNSTICLSSDEDSIEKKHGADSSLISDDEDDDDLPSVEVTAKRKTLIKNLFPKEPKSVPNTKFVQQTIQLPSSSRSKPLPSRSVHLPTQPKETAIFERMIGGVKVHLPVNPYGCQVALMAKLITALNKKQNCLLESPTGSGKTLALLCAALAWQFQQKANAAKTQAEFYFSAHPELNVGEGVVDYIASPVKTSNNPEDLFKKTVFGEKSIYDKENDPNIDKFQAVAGNNIEDSPAKKRKLHGGKSGDYAASAPEIPDLQYTAKEKLADFRPSTPNKPIEKHQPDTPPNIRHLLDLVENLQVRTSMVANSSIPTIYYGARTHKQLQQVIKEFSRTWYCGQVKMTVLSSREHSCIREFDRNLWRNRDDMCRECIKPQNRPADQPKGSTNCKYYDNKSAMTHRTLPPAFDIEDLVETGKDKLSCPYFAAKAMAPSADIVFCPYNYLITPSIRNSMQIDLEGSILVIDEAHNIEDICRDSATFKFSRDDVMNVIKELDVVLHYRFRNSDVESNVEYLRKALSGWDDWFINQTPLLSNKPLNFNEAVHMWQVEHFVQTLNNHNIGVLHYEEYSQNCAMFCKKLREDPRSLIGVTQATANLLETIDAVLEYMYSEGGKFRVDFKPALVKSVTNNSNSWRKSVFNKTIESEVITLRILCLSPARVFHSLQPARTVCLASGTLTPMLSLHSELETTFPHTISPNHVIPPDRVWVGSLSSGPNNVSLDCSSRGADSPATQDALGAAVRATCLAAPSGVLAFLPSYRLLQILQTRWQETGLWQELEKIKHVFSESKIVKDHNSIMEDYYQCVETAKGALLFAVYRGKVSEGMDFKDHQARAVIAIGVPYPNPHEMSVREKMDYNDRFSSERGLLRSNEWLRVQAYRALNQAVGRCVRHRGDWGAVLLLDARYRQPYYTEHLAKWVRNFLGNNHHTYESMQKGENSLTSFMKRMTEQSNNE